MSDTTCPSSEELAKLIGGSLGESRLERLMAHIDGCVHCQTRIEQIDARDSLAAELSELRGRSPSPTAKHWKQDFAATAVNTNLQLPAEIGPYRLLRKIAVGGMGTVYEARHRKLGRPFAVKLLHYGLGISRAEAQRVRSEWCAHGRLVHPNVVSATDAGIADGQPYLVTERIVGADLASLIRHHGPLDPIDACEIVRQAAAGLQYAHEQQLIHGDVKPSNLMLDSRGVVKLLDLGTAKRIDVENLDSNATGTTHGTLAYMAPEQLRTVKVPEDHQPVADHRADIYSLGCTLYFLLTGAPPFGNQRDCSNQQLIDAHQKEAPKPIASLVSGLDQLPQLQSIVDRMLAKSPADRYSSMSELSDQLNPICEPHDLAALAAAAGVIDPVGGSEEFTDTAWQLRGDVDSRSRGTTPLRMAAAVCFAIFAAAALALRETPSIRSVSPNRSNAADQITVDLREKSAFPSPAALIRNRGERVWAGSPREGALEGVVLQPATLTGIADWQIESIAPRGRVQGLGWSADGKHLAVTSGDGHLRLYRWSDDRLELSWILALRDRKFGALAWHPDRDELLVESDLSVCLIKADKAEIVRELSETESINDVQWHPRGEAFGYSTESHFALVDFDSFQSALIPAESGIRSFAWSSSADRLVAATERMIRLYDTTGNQMKRIASCPVTRNAACHRVGWTAGDFPLLMWRKAIARCERDTLKILESFPLDRNSDSIDVQYPDGDLAVGYRGNVMRTRKSAPVIRRICPNEYSARPQVAWHPAGNRLAVGSTGTLAVLDNDLKDVHRIGANNGIVGVDSFGSGDCCIMARNGKLCVLQTDGSILETVIGWNSDDLTTHNFKLLQPSGRVVAHTVDRNGIATNLDISLRHRFESNDPNWRQIVGVPEASKSGQQILVFDKSRKAWNELDYKPEIEFSLSVGPAFQQVAIAQRNAKVSLISLDDPDQTQQWNLRGIRNPMKICWHHAANRFLIAARENNFLRIACLDATGGEQQWLIERAESQRTASLAVTNDKSFVHAGDYFVEFDAATGSVTREIDTEAMYGFRHHRLHQSEDFQYLYSWPIFSYSHFVCTSEPAVCWAAKSIAPRWCAFPVGRKDWITFTPSGQIIDMTSTAPEQLIWMVDAGTGVELKSLEEFHELWRSQAAINQRHKD